MSLAKNLKLKGAIDFSSPPPQPDAQQMESVSATEHTESSIGAIPKGMTPAGMARHANQQRTEVFKENEDLKTQLKQWDGASAAKKIDPKLIDPSEWANRHDRSFDTKEFKDLTDEIENAGGNVQPIKVRPISNTSPQRYQIIFGHRRHRACLQLGLDVLAMVSDINDQNLFIEMDRENRQRADLRPYEHGLMYQQALDRGLFSSARKLADSLGVDLASMGKTLALAKLPSDVLRAFENPLDLQYGWGPKLNKAIANNPDLVLAEAKRIQGESPRPLAKQVLERLTNGGSSSIRPSLNAVKKVSLTGSNGQSGSISIGPTDNSLVVDLQNVSQARFNELEKLIQKFLG